ncbi:MAG: hypothetical protein H6557_26590 [Lewinellaceae bacterium]|nr:hypothetical protein [Lewinellaceae bacterium]
MKTVSNTTPLVGEVVTFTYSDQPEPGRDWRSGAGAENRNGFGTLSNTTPLVGEAGDRPTFDYSDQPEDSATDNATSGAVQDAVPNGYTNITNIKRLSGTLSGNTITWSGTIT